MIKENQRSMCMLKHYANKFPHDEACMSVFCQRYFVSSSFLSGLLRKIESDNWEITFSYSIIVKRPDLLSLFTLACEMVEWIMMMQFVQRKNTLENQIKFVQLTFLHLQKTVTSLLHYTAFPYEAMQSVK